MRTSKEYMNNLKNRTITKDMLIDALYSVNKRAKNHRDKANEAWYIYNDKFHAYERETELKEAFYKKKDVLLTLLKPVCIHKELVSYEKERIEDYDSRFYDAMAGKLGEIANINRYYSYEYEGYVEFVDIYIKNRPIYHYYLFYDINAEHTFHTPIKEQELEGWLKKGLEVVDIGRLITAGCDVEELVSCQIIDKVIALIESDDYTYVAE